MGAKFKGGDAGNVRPLVRRTLSLVGILPDEVLHITRLFASADRAQLVAAIQQEAGLPWVHPFEATWTVDEREARSRGLFDLLWRRRATECDPIVTAPNFAGLDVLFDAARTFDPELADLLANVDAGRDDNPRRKEGPEWWRAWHDGTGTSTSGWLERDEIKAISALWGRLSNPEVEEACLTAMGVTYTHPGCWTLLSDLGGFFAQCACENRVVVAEVDD